MPRIKKQLTAIEVARLAEKQGRHAVGDGLYLFVGPKHSPDACSWAYRYMVNGKARTMGLGSYPATKLAEARQLVADRKRQRLLGLDPLAVKRAEAAQQKATAAKALTFQQAAVAYIDHNRAGWRNEKHAAQWTATLKTYAFPLIGSTPVHLIETPHIVRILEQPAGSGSLWTAKTETATRVRGRIEAILDYARVRGHRDGENPARWKGHLDQVLPAPNKVRTVKHHPALRRDLLPSFMTALRQREGVAAQALEFAILTVARTGEVRSATWSEIDIKERLWTVPAAKMKAIRDHRVPLSSAALALLKRLPQGEGDSIVFWNVPTRKLSDAAIGAVIDRMNGKNHAPVWIDTWGEAAVPHGFRSTFRDWVSEETNFPTEAAEMALAHAVGDRVEAAYRRGDLLDRRRAMMEAWSSFCAGEAGASVRRFKNRGAA